MTTFSQRYGYTPIEKAFQRESLDNELRMALWNLLDSRLWNGQGYVTLIAHVWVEHLNRDRGLLDHARNMMKDHFFKCPWFAVYDLLEFLIQSKVVNSTQGMSGPVNDILAKFNAAYRVVDNQIVEITDQNEIRAVEEGLIHPDTPVRTHLQTALSMLSDRTKPDYRNSIKESISAVEAVCRLVTGDEKTTLGEALKKVNDLHPALSKAFSALYGFTSDAGGVRHSLLDEPTTTYEEAKFMLVSCSAFVSYLRPSATKP